MLRKHVQETLHNTKIIQSGLYFKIHAKTIN